MKKYDGSDKELWCGDISNEFDSLAEAEVFEYGFRFGAMMMVNIFAEK